MMMSKSFACASLVSLLTLAASLPASAAEISASSSTLLEELATRADLVRPLARADMLQVLAQAGVISIGESHETGLERQLTAALYMDLAQAIDSQDGAVGKIRKCLVEDFDVLLGKLQPASDPVLAQFSRLCSDKLVVTNPGMDYTELLKPALKNKSDRVITHTGSRHILPFGKIYGQDFPIPSWAANWVDLDPRGTITAQVPDKYVDAGRTMASHTIWAIDGLLTQMAALTLKSLPTDAAARASAIAALDARLAALESSPALQFGERESSRTYEMTRVQASFGYARAFFTLMDHKLLKMAALRALIRSPELIAFMDQAMPGKWQFVYFRGGDRGQAAVGTRMLGVPGTIYLTGKSKDGARGLLLSIDSTSLKPVLETL